MSLRTNLRKTFSYPSSDTSSTSDPAELDEEHQEHLIAQLAREDAAKNTFYLNFFLSLPLLSAFFFLYTLLFTARTARTRGEAILSISSLLCTAYILRYQPLEATTETGRDKQKKNMMGKRAGFAVGRGGGGMADSPLERLLMPLNIVLVGLMQFSAGLSWSRGAPAEDGWRLSLPSIVFALCLFARQQLRPLDLGELEKARYDLKGA